MSRTCFNLASVYAWDNAKKGVEAGQFGGKSSDAHPLSQVFWGHDA